MNRIRSTVRIVVRTAALSARLTRCVAIRLTGYATQQPRPARPTAHRLRDPRSAPAQRNRRRYGVACSAENGTCRCPFAINRGSW